MLLQLSNTSLKPGWYFWKKPVSHDSSGCRPQVAFSPNMRDRRNLENDVFSGLLCLDEGGSSVQACLSSVPLCGTNVQAGIHPLKEQDTKWNSSSRTGGKLH